MLHLTELAIDSHAHRQAPDMPPRAYSHVDNEGVKALVDSICTRMRMRGGEGEGAGGWVGVGWVGKREGGAGVRWMRGGLCVWGGQGVSRVSSNTRVWLHAHVYEGR